MKSSLFSVSLMSFLVSVSNPSHADIIDGGVIYNGPSAPFKQSPEPLNACSSGTITSYQPGSIIDCRDQTLFQTVPITGTGFSLNYSSRNQPATEGLGRTLKMDIEKFSANDPARFGKLLNVKASLTILGSVFEKTYVILPNENLDEPFVFEYTWDGNDANGQKLNGLVQSEIRIEYNFEGSPDTGPRTVFLSKKATFGNVDASRQNLGGWSLSGYHAFHPMSGNIVLGSGIRLPVENLNYGPTYLPDSTGIIRVPSMDTSEVYHFTSDGLHHKTVDALTGIAKYSFQHDSLGRLVSVTDRHGLATTFERDSAGNIAAIVGPFGARTTISLDADSLISEIRDPMGRTRKFTYATGTQKGLMVGYTDPMGRTKEYSFDSDGLLITASDFKGSMKNISREAGKTTSYGMLVQTVRHTSPMGRVTTYETEQYENSIRFRNFEPNGLSTSFQSLPKYFNQGFVWNDGRSSTIWNEPDPRFPERVYPKSVEKFGISGSKITSSRNYTLLNPADPYSMTQYTSTMTLDGIGTYTSTFDKAAMKQVDTSPSGRVATKLFDSKGQLIESRIGNLEPEKYTYNLKGQLTRITQGARVKRFTYNGRGLLATSTNPLGEVERFTYNLNGLITSQTLANGDVYQFTYNPNNLLRSVKMPDERVYTQSYNVNSYPATFREPMFDESEYLWRTNYNFDNDITRYRLPDQSLISWGYDSQGRVSSQVGPGIQKTFGYTSIGLINSIQWSPADRLLIDGNSEHLRSVTWEGETKGKVSYTWATFSRLSGLRINDRFAGGFTYTKEGEVSTVLTANATLSLIRTQDTGLLSASKIGSITTEQGYNLFGELTNLAAKIGSTSLASYTYTRDNLGRITEITSPTGSKAFSYDAKGQLISATENGATKIFSYTRNGNRLTANGQEVYDSQERLTSDAYWTYTYGRNGELQRKDHKINGSSAHYIYDAAGNLLSVKTADGTLIEYKSDGLDRRISRRVNGQFSYGLLYQDNLRPLAQVDQSGIVIASFIYGSRSNSPDLMTKDGITYRFIHDHLGSIIFVVNSISNQVAQALTYDVWGNVVSDSNPGFQPFGFAGGLYDSASGLIRFGARDYDPANGRWLNKDPIRFEGGFNLYSYTNNDPINFVDPTGEVGLAGVIIGAGFELGVQAFSNYSKGCDVLDYQNYDWADVAVSAAVGGLAPGLMTVGKTSWTSGSAIKTLSKQLANAKTLNRVVKIESRISKHQNRIIDIVLDQAGWQAAKTAGKQIFGED